MNLGFWQKLKKPIMVLAPMADVTDAAFRRVIAKYGKPDVLWTEFVSADGLVLAPEAGKQKLLRDFIFTEAERPIVAQLFTSHPDRMREAAKMVKALGFDGLDINMGCPDKSIEKQGAGAALITTPQLARDVIRAAKEGAGDLPVSVKTRVGFNRVELETWLPELLAEEPAVITIHARTRKELSKVPARWEHVARAVEIRDNFILPNGEKSKTLIFGNGDVLDLADAEQKVTATKADGIMLGRAIFGNPWLFSGPTKTQPADIKERLRVMVEHTKLYEELLGDIKNFAIMKKHFRAYVTDFPGLSELRAKLMQTENAAQVAQIVEEFTLPA
jgi:nifR3 family TIM-barrel protein